MRRGNKRKFGREKKPREVLLRSLATALIQNGRIKTTTAKAKTLAQYFDRLMTLAKRQNIQARREILKQIGIKASDKLIKDIAPNSLERSGGYTKIVRLGQRRSDAAPMTFIEIIK